MVEVFLEVPKVARRAPRDAEAPKPLGMDEALRLFATTRAGRTAATQAVEADMANAILSAGRVTSKTCEARCEGRCGDDRCWISRRQLHFGSLFWETRRPITDFHFLSTVYHTSDIAGAFSKCFHFSSFPSRRPLLLVRP